MPQLKNTIEILKILNKSNCGDCGKKTCLAFAASVFNGQNRLDECPHLDDKTIEFFGGETATRKTIEEDIDEEIGKLKREVSKIDFSLKSQKVEGKFSNSKLTIKVFGKDVNVARDGSLSSDIHINTWLAMPLLSYILNCEGLPVSGKWMPFRELENGRSWQGLFRRQCEMPLKKIADNYTALFKDMIEIFNGKEVENHYESDISLVLRPLPKIPILICYWKPDEGLESDFNIFFDSTAIKNGGIETIYALATGLAKMFGKIALRHGIS